MQITNNLNVTEEKDHTIEAFIQTVKKPERRGAGRSSDGNYKSKIKPGKSLTVHFENPNNEKLKIIFQMSEVPEDVNEGGEFVKGVSITPGKRVTPPPHDVDFREIEDSSGKIRYEASLIYDFSEKSEKEKKGMLTDLDPHVEHPKSFP